MKGYKILHIHWVYQFTFPGASNISRLLSTIYYYSILTFIKLCGYKIIWTVHNVIPHKKILNNDVRARRFLSKISSAKIIHSSATKTELQRHDIDTDNCFEVPIGNYIGIYPNTISKSDARKTLKLSPKDFVFLFLGRIEPYKGIENLVSEFSKLKMPQTKLIIAGRCSDSKFKKKILKYAKSPNIMIDDRYIPDSEIQTFFNAANIAVYPFDKVTTSSGVILAMSYKLPVIFPKTGNLSDLPDSIGYSYNHTDSQGLKRCLRDAATDKSKTAQLGTNAYSYVKKLDWQIIANTTAKIYRNVLKQSSR